MTAAKGHNSIAGDRLKSFVERIEKLTEEKAALAADIREVMSEAKGTGFEPKYIRYVVRQRAKKAAQRAEEEEMQAIYLRALGMLD